jgi:putative transposase
VKKSKFSESQIVGILKEYPDCYAFDSLQDVRDTTTDWLHRYNHLRPDESLRSVPLV